MKRIGLLLSVSILAAFAFAGAAFAGDLVIKGSTTVLPIGQAAAEKFMEAHPDTKISVSGGGSGNGIKAIIDQTTDIAMATRSFARLEERGISATSFRAFQSAGR